MPATASVEAGQPLKLKEEQPDGKSHSSSFFSILRVTTTPKEKEKRKRKKGAKLLSCLSIQLLGYKETGLKSNTEQGEIQR